MKNTANLSESVQIAEAAPGLWRSFLDLNRSGAMSLADLERLKRVFSLTAEIASKFEAGVNRPEQADFNPRTARVAQILIKENQAASASIFISAFLACTNAKFLRQLSQSQADFGAEIALAREALRFPDTVSLESERIALAILIDDIRHLHQRSIQESDLKSILDDIGSNLIPSIRHLENERLRELALASIQRLLRLRGLDDQEQ